MVTGVTATLGRRSPVNILHDVPGPGQLDLQLPTMFHKEVHQRPGDRRRGVEEKGRDPQDGGVQPLQAQEEVVPVLHRQQVVVVFLQDAGVKGRHVGPLSHVSLKQLRRRKVAAEDKVEGVDLPAAARARQDAAVAHHGAGVVVLLGDRRRLGEQRAEALPDGEDVLVAGVVVVH